nr:hypothetical protein [Tanacetum cinerariifolium]
TKRLFNSKRNQKPLHSKHAPPPAKLSPPPRNPILRSAKHAPPLANLKPKTPNLKPFDVTESDEKEGDDSGSEEEGDEEEDEKKVDEEEDEEEGDEEEDEKDGDQEEDEEEVDKQDDEEKCNEEEDDEEEVDEQDDEEKCNEEEDDKEDEKEGDEEDDEKEGDEEDDEKEGNEEEDEKEEGNEEEDEEESDGEDDEEKVDEEEDEEDAIVNDEDYKEEEKVSEEEEEEEEEEDINVKRNKHGRKGKGEDSEPSSSEDEKPLKKKKNGKGKGPRVVHVTAKKVHEILGLPIGGISLCDLLERREDDEFVQHWLNQFALKKKKRIFATDIAEKLVRSTRVDVMFEVNFLMLFANVMGKADTMRAFVNLSVVRRIREDTNIAGLNWCDFIYCCLAISHEPNTVSGFYNGPLCFLIIICEMIEEKLSRISKEKAEVETLLRDANKEFPKDDNEASVKIKPADVKAKEAAEKPKPVENVKELAEKLMELAEKAQEAPQNLKPKPAAVKTKEGAEKPKLVENVKEVAEKPKEPAEKAQEAPQYVKPKPAAVKTNEAAKKPMPAENVKELAEKPKEPAGDDYQVVPAATVMKAKNRKEFKVETFTQWIEGNIDWVGEPRVVEPINMVQHSTPKRVFSSPSKGYVKPVKTVNTPYMCRRSDVTARCKRIEFVLGNSLFAMEGDKYETIFQSLGGYRELSSVRVNIETLAPTLFINANVIDCWVALLNFEELALGYPTPTRHFFPTGCINQGIIKGTLTEEEHHFYVVVFNIKKPKTMVILDNSDYGYGYASKYKEACDPLNHSSHEAVAKMRPFIPKLKWRTSNNHVDYGVFAMIHMENYVGDAAKNWEFSLCEESDE